MTRIQDGKCRDRSRGRSRGETGLGHHKVQGGQGAGGTGWEWGAERGISKHKQGWGRGSRRCGESPDQLACNLGTLYCSTGAHRKSGVADAQPDPHFHPNLCMLYNSKQKEHNLVKLGRARFTYLKIMTATIKILG